MDEYIWKTVLSAATAYLIPRLLGGLGKTFAAEASAAKRQAPIGPWLVAGAVGGAVGSAISAALGDQGALNWAVYGAALGIMQWFALRTYLPVGGWFALASALGWSLAALPLPPLMGAALVGLALGLLQSIGLGAEGKGWWIAGNLIAWTVTGALLPVLVSIVMPLGPVMGWLAGWALLALVGFALLIYPLTKLQAKSGSS